MYFISVSKEIDQLLRLHQMADVWSKANKTSHLRSGAVMSYALLYEMTFLDHSTFAIGATLSMSLVKHYPGTYLHWILMAWVIPAMPPNLYL